jgi:phosphoribosylformylglycinamidine cyclo-ligase
MKRKLTYKVSGVDIRAGDLAVKRIKQLARSTFTTGVLTDIGLFAGFFSLGKYKLKNPTLVSSIDGVGTKLKVVFMMNKHHTVGEDLVFHCVNDILVHGAKPLFFLDYIACGKLSPKIVKEIVEGLAAGCRKTGCALIGGETAEMPDFYKKGEYDLAGCIVGLVEKNRIINGRNIKPTDQIIGLGSNGLHTNGYSLARKVIFGLKRMKATDYVPELKDTIGNQLLKAHRCYAKPIHKILEKYEIKGMAHITGGGIEGNLVRILPQNCKALIDTKNWKVPELFNLIQKWGEIEENEMYKVFNMGIGYVLVVSKRDTDKILSALERIKEKGHLIGEVVRGKKEVKLRK